MMRWGIRFFLEQAQVKVQVAKKKASTKGRSFSGIANQLLSLVEINKINY